MNPINLIPVPQVHSRSEWNSSLYLVPRWRPKLQQRVDSYLKMPFPIHQVINYVEMHNQGFKDTLNLDFFKHLYRQYIMNGWAINATRNFKKYNPIQILQMPQQQHQKPEFFQVLVAKEDDDLRLFTELLMHIDVTPPKTGQIAKYKKSITYQTLDLRVPQIDDKALFQLQDVFIERILQLIEKEGLKDINYYDYVTFKTIVQDRLKGLGDAKDFVKILKMKQSFQKIQIIEQFATYSYKPEPKQQFRQLSRWSNERSLYSLELLQLASQVGLDGRLIEARKLYSTQQNDSNYQVLSEVAEQIQLETQKQMLSTLQKFSQKEYEEVSSMIGLKYSYQDDLQQSEIIQFENVDDNYISDHMLSRQRNSSEFYEKSQQYIPEKTQESELEQLLSLHRQQNQVLKDKILQVHAQQSKLEDLQKQLESIKDQENPYETVIPQKLESQNENQLKQHKKPKQQQLQLSQQSQQQQQISNQPVLQEPNLPVDEDVLPTLEQFNTELIKQQKDINQIKSLSSLTLSEHVDRPFIPPTSTADNTIKDIQNINPARSQVNSMYIRGTISKKIEVQDILEEEQEVQVIQFKQIQSEVKVGSLLDQNSSLPAIPIRLQDSISVSIHLVDKSPSTNRFNNNSHNNNNNNTNSVHNNTNTKSVHNNTNINSVQNNGSDHSNSVTSRVSVIVKQKKKKEQIDQQPQKSKKNIANSVLQIDRIDEVNEEVSQPTTKPLPMSKQKSMRKPSEMQTSQKKSFFDIGAQKKSQHSPPPPKVLTVEEQEKQYLTHLKAELKASQNSDVTQMKETVKLVMEQMQGVKVDDELQYYMQLYKQRQQEKQSANNAAQEIPVKIVQPLVDIKLKQKSTDRNLKFSKNFNNLPNIQKESEDDETGFSFPVKTRSYNEEKEKEKHYYIRHPSLPKKIEEPNYVIQTSLNGFERRTPDTERITIQRIPSLLQPIVAVKQQIKSSRPAGASLRERITSLKSMPKSVQDNLFFSEDYPYLQKYKPNIINILREAPYGEMFLRRKHSQFQYQY